MNNGDAEVNTETASSAADKTPKSKIENSTFVLSRAKGAREKAWVRQECTFLQFLDLFSNHRLDRKKDGPAFVAGELNGVERKAQAMNAAYFMVFDIDAAQSYDEVRDILNRENIHAIMYTTYSHLKTKSYVKTDKFVQWCKKNGIDPANETGVLHTQERMEKYVDDADMREKLGGEFKVEERLAQTEEGMQICLTHKPIEKFRVLIPLGPIFVFSLHGYTSGEQAQAWKRSYVGVGRKLGLKFDMACADPSHIFYLPSHPELDDGREAPHRLDHLIDPVVEGGPPRRMLDFNKYPKADLADTGKRSATSAGLFMENVTAGAGGATSASGTITKAWLKKHRGTFKLAALLQDRQRTHGPNTIGGLTCDCPFSETHTDGKETGAFVVDADPDNEKAFVFSCSHGCKERHKTENGKVDVLPFLEKMLAEGWITRDDLENPEYGGGPLDNRKRTLNVNADHAHAVAAMLVAAHRGLLADDVVMSMCVEQWKSTTGALAYADRTRIFERIGHYAEKLAPFAHEVLALVPDTQLRLSSARQNFVWELDPPMDQATECVPLLIDHNAATPKFFNYIGEAAALKDGRTQRLSSKHVQIELGYLTTWQRKRKEDVAYIPTPPAIGDIVLSQIENRLPKLEWITDVPFFDKTGKLIATEGYNEGAATYYLPKAGLKITLPPEKPTKEETQEALAKLVEPFAEFPFNGPADFCNFMAMIIQPFVRQMINGPTPIYLVRKPDVGTGASLLTNSVAQICFGEDAKTTSEKRDDEETRKTITALVAGKARYIVFDDMTARIEHPSFRVLATSPRWTDRELGSSREIDVANHIMVAMTANNPKFNNDMKRRFLQIGMDAGVERPEERTGFKYRLDEVLPLWRSELVSAVLLLIQSWIADGRPKGKRVLASFESYSDVIGGILRNAGADAFLGGREVLDKGSADSKDAVVPFLVLMRKTFGTKLVNVGGLDFNEEPVRYTDGTCNTHDLAHLLLAHRNELSFWFMEKNQKAWGNLLGTELGKHLDKVFTLDGVPYRLEKPNPKRGAWQLKCMWTEAKARAAHEGEPANGALLEELLACRDDAFDYAVGE